MAKNEAKNFLIRVNEAVAASIAENSTRIRAYSQYQRAALYTLRRRIYT